MNKKMMITRSPLMAAIVAVALTGGCMGSFGLTKAVYGWNDTVTGNKIVNNLIFWALAIVPVYGTTMFIDVVILNTVEFWTGSKVIGAADGADNGERVVVNAHDDGSVTIVRGDQVFTLVPDGADRVVVVVDGQVKGTASRAADGSVVATDVDGAVLTAISSDEVVARQQQIAALTP